MSDVSNGPGWWVASDGKWYPPEKHPDPQHATAFGDQASFSDTLSYPEHPPLTEQVEVVASPVTEQLPSAPPAVTLPTPPTSWMGSFDGPPPTVDRGSNRVVAVVVFAMGIAMIVGSFGPWVSFGGAYEGSQSGWDRADGIVTIVVGLVLAAVAGVLFVGVQSLIVKLTMLLAGVVGFLVFLIDIVDIEAESNAATERFALIEIDVAWGIWLVGAAALIVVVAALVERSRWSVDQ